MFLFYYMNLQFKDIGKNSVKHPKESPKVKPNSDPIDLDSL
jgi:hypothetical protein